MAARARVMHAVNPMLIHNPEAALTIAGSLLAVGGAVTLRQIIHKIGVNTADLTDDEQKEIELLDAEAPAGFFHQAVDSIHASLLATRLRGSGIARMRWHRGFWTVHHTVKTPDEITDLSTPWLEERDGTGQLVTHGPIGPLSR